VSRRNAIQQGYDRFGREAGFTKASGSWYGYSPEVISVTNLQKSQYGPRYFLNQCFWIRAVGDERYPPPSRCHIQTRAEGLVPSMERKMSDLLDLDTMVDEDARSTEVERLLIGELLPVIRRADSVDGLRGMLADGLLAHAGITLPAQQALATG
jgi:Domain of unknown function (DUF4304)